MWDRYAWYDTSRARRELGWKPRALGESLWRILGGGAVGLPLLGLGLALAGFDRVPRLDMKRMAILLGGLALLTPFTIGVISDVPPPAFDPPLSEWGLAARLTG